ncbi:hypothetical protein [Metabacillus arenae]|uniref:Uncharacterized protein n=1 Tax=Metabacillus arenae TaxID=2771434 RepID=A0A926NMB1_9BACI|nr:hypothetical protein [Metabacillus arenae]MBD1380436.1 hypothetical protein [Metabacillus arenae]
MHKRVLQAILFLGILSFPAFASAEGGLLNSTEVKAEKDKSVMEEIKEAKSTDNDRKEDNSNTVDKVVPTVTESLSKRNDKVTNSFSDEKPRVEVNLSEEPSLEEDAGAVKANESKQPNVKVETEVGDVEASKGSSVNVNAGVGEADVSRDSSVEVSEDHSVKIKTGGAAARVEDHKSVHLDAGGVDDKRPVKSEEGSFKPGIEEAPVTKEKPSAEETVNNEVDGKTPVQIQKDRTNILTIESDGQRNGNPKAIEKNTTPVNSPPIESKDHLVGITVSQNVPSSSTMTLNGFSSSMSMLGVVYSIYQDKILTYSVHNGKNKIFFDQWLNAPPSQPPQGSLLLKKA